jgi:2-dehydro-3-deoxy-D-arabinonate dehydratase
MTGDQISGHFTMSLHELLRLSASELRSSIEQAMRESTGSQPVANLQAPIDGVTEVWAAGVTYKRSVDARIEESETPDIYTRAA